jgi:hypothetical protein
MSGLFTVAIAALGGLVGGPAATEPAQDDRSFRYENTGRAAPFFYHQIRADCETITHGFGRNSAWGRWTLPVARIELAAAADGQVIFGCSDASPCISVENLAGSPARIEQHEFVFETREGAEAFVDRVARLKAACATDPGAGPTSLSAP